MRLTHLPIVLAVCVLGMTFQAVAQEPVRLLYLSGVHTLQGHVYKPAGKGPFPVVVYAQASLNPAQLPARYQPFPALARFFASKGYVFFVPGRHHAPPQEDLPSAGSVAEAKLIRAHEIQAVNLAAAVAGIKAQSYVDENRVVLLGDSAGGVSSLFAVKHEMSVTGMILFSPGTQALKGNPTLAERMIQGVRKAHAPIFLMQTKNDANLLPAEILGPEIENRGRGNYVRIYPAYGQSPTESHKFLTDGYAAWQEDVLDFLRTVNEPAGAPSRLN